MRASGPLFKQEMSCREAIDQLLLDATSLDFGSIFYVLLNGWYLGAWGDYGSCVADAKYGQYVLVTMEGDYDMQNQAVFTRGALGKYKRFATHVGMCVPYQCSDVDMQSMNDHFMSMAQNANWTDVSVSYKFSSRDDTEFNSKPSSVGMIVVLMFVAVMILVSVAGTIVELTKIGDKKGLDYKRLNPVAKFQSIKQYEPIAFQRKTAWAQAFMVFSALRNFMQFSKQPRAYQIS